MWCPILFFALLFIWFILRLFKKKKPANSDTRHRGSNGGGGEADAFDPVTGKKKKYGKSEGEYAEFEEVKASTDTESAPQEAQEENGAKQFTHEEQISDAEFEDIP